MSCIDTYRLVLLLLHCVRMHASFGMLAEIQTQTHTHIQMDVLACGSRKNCISFWKIPILFISYAIAYQPKGMRCLFVANYTISKLIHSFWGSHTYAHSHTKSKLSLLIYKHCVFRTVPLSLPLYLTPFFSHSFRLLATGGNCGMYHHHLYSFKCTKT